MIMTTQISTKLAALGAALLINAMMLSSVAMLFGTQTYQHVAASALVRTAPYASLQAPV
jgi:hypothetical protein